MLVNIKIPQENTDLLPPAIAEIGIDRDVAPEPGMILGRFHIQPETKTRQQYIINADLALFVVKGSGNLITGPAHSAEVDSFEDKDFIFIERGEIFSIETSANETCTLIFTYVGADHIAGFQRTFVEGPLN